MPAHPSSPSKPSADRRVDSATAAEPSAEPTDEHSSAVPALLQRRLGVGGAMMMGLGSIVGTGVFVSIGLAGAIAGPAVMLAIAAAAFVAVCNGLSSAQLAAAHPVSGGTYEYGHRYLRPSLGFSAGWLFLCAKSASAATAALGFAGYLLAMIGGGGPWTRRGVALTAVAVLTVVVLGGIRRSSWVNITIVSVTLAALAAFVGFGSGPAIQQAGGTWRPFFAGDTPADSMQTVLHAAALMFVAYTGYGRIATLGEEVRRPRRTIPRAVIATLAVSMLLYVAVAAVAVGAAGRAGLADAIEGNAAPLEEIARGFGVRGLDVVLAVGAMTAMLGVLLNLILGLSRVWLAMGRRGDMPGRLGRLNAAGTTPTPAVALVAVVVGGLAMIGDVKTTWTFSAFTVLLYYAMTNLAALALPRADRLFPRALAWAGLAGCGFLAFWVPWRIWLAGLGVLAVGLAWHAVRRKMRQAINADAQ